MFSKLLQMCGLISLKNAKKMNAKIVEAYSRAVTEYASRDFGVEKNTNQKVDEWANNAFDLMKKDPTGELVCEWENKTEATKSS